MYHQYLFPFVHFEFGLGLSLAARSLPEKAYYELYSNNKENVEDITFIPDKSARRMVYEPETERYGGPRSLPHCEKIFSLSSKYTLGIRKNSGNSVMKRIIGGLDLFTTQGQGAVPEPLQPVLERVRGGKQKTVFHGRTGREIQKTV